MKKTKPKRFKDHFDKFPPILREMVMEAMNDLKKEGFIKDSNVLFNTPPNIT